MLARQIRERITSHALLAVDATRTQVTFDHDHFREFFLGEMIASYLTARSNPDLRKLLRIGPLAPFAFDTAISVCLTSGIKGATLINDIHGVALTEGAASFVRENCSALITRVLNRFDSHDGAVIQKMVFPNNSLEQRLSGVTFEKCFFQSTGVSSEMRRLEFDGCEFEWLEIDTVAKFEDVTMKKCSVHGVGVRDKDGNSREF
jgi:hypothetical protein